MPNVFTRRRGHCGRIVLLVTDLLTGRGCGGRVGCSTSSPKTRRGRRAPGESWTLCRFYRRRSCAGFVWLWAWLIVWIASWELAVAPRDSSATGDAAVIPIVELGSAAVDGAWGGAAGEGYESGRASVTAMERLGRDGPRGSFNATTASFGGS